MSVPPPRGSALGRTVRAFGVLAASNVLGQLFGFAALAYVARRAGPTGLGAYSFDLAVCTYFGLAANLGVSYLATRDVATARERAALAVWEVVLVQGSLSLVVYGFLVLGAPVIAQNASSQHLLPIVALTVPITALTLDWALLALRRSSFLSGWRLAGQVAYAVGVFALIRGNNVVYLYALLNVLGLAVTGVGVAAGLRTVLRSAPRYPDVKSLGRRIRRSAPFAYSLLMLQIYAAIAIPLLAYLASTQSVGIYAAAYRLPNALISVANVWLAVLFPHSAERLRRNSTEFLKELGQIVTVTAVISLAIAVAAALCARDLMPALFGSQFRASAAPFALLSAASALVLLQATTSNALLASGNERRYARIITAVAVGITVTDCAVIPFLGPVGAGCASVGAEAAIVILTMREVRRRIGPYSVRWARIRRGVGSVVVMAASLVATRTSHSAILEVAVAAVSFAGGAVVFGAFRAGLLDRVRRAKTPVS